jgi:hypothetical protein
MKLEADFRLLHWYGYFSFFRAGRFLFRTSSRRNRHGDVVSTVSFRSPRGARIVIRQERRRFSGSLLVTVNGHDMGWCGETEQVQQPRLRGLLEEVYPILNTRASAAEQLVRAASEQQEHEKRRREREVLRNL